jgi:hypothetical protein
MSDQVSPAGWKQNVPQVHMWRGAYVYQLAVLSCMTLTHFVTVRNSLWLELGNHDDFWLVLASFTDDVLGCLNLYGESEVIERTQQDKIKRHLISLNHSKYRQVLEKRQPSTHSFMGHMRVDPI